MSATPAWRRLFIALAVLYAGIFPYHPKLRSPNELSRLLQTRAIVEYGTLQLDQALAEYGHAGDLSFYEGHYYPSKAPLLSFAAVPLYALLRLLRGGSRHAVPEIPLVFFSRLLLTILPTLVMLVFVRRFLRAYVRDAIADGLVVTYALGSLAFSYSELFMSHQTTAVLLFFAFYTLWRCAGGAGFACDGRSAQARSIGGEWRERGYLAAGFFASAAVAAEYTGAIGVLGLVFYGLLVFHFREGAKRERLIALARASGLATLGALPCLLLLAAYHTRCFGHPLTTGYKHLADAGYQPWHLGGFLGIRYPSPRAFVLSFFSPLRGLFVLSPFLLLAFPGLSRLAKADRALFGLTLLLLACYTYFTSSFSYESWGWTTGPRHLTGLIPFLLLPVALFFESRADDTNLSASIARGLGAGLCAVSMLVTGALTFCNYVTDSVTNALFGFAVPLLKDGYLVPTVLGFLGVRAPWQSVPFLLLFVALIALAVSALAAGRPGRMVRHGVAAATIALCLGVLALVPSPKGDADQVRFLESNWLSPPGSTFKLWSQYVDR
jgi:hypothetical protein